MALVGNEQVFTRMTGGSRAAAFDRLYSRIGKRVRLSRATAADADVMADALGGVTDIDSRTLLAEIAGQPGALRGLTKVLRLAGMYAAHAGRARSVQDLRTAWRDLGGG